MTYMSPPSPKVYGIVYRVKPRADKGQSRSHDVRARMKAAREARCAQQVSV